MKNIKIRFFLTAALLFATPPGANAETTLKIESVKGGQIVTAHIYSPEGQWQAEGCPQGEISSKCNRLVFRGSFTIEGIEGGHPFSISIGFGTIGEAKNRFSINLNSAVPGSIMDQAGPNKTDYIGLIGGKVGESGAFKSRDCYSFKPYPAFPKGGIGCRFEEDAPKIIKYIDRNFLGLVYFYLYYPGNSFDGKPTVGRLEFIDITYEGYRKKFDAIIQPRLKK